MGKCHGLVAFGVSTRARELLRTDARGEAGGGESALVVDPGEEDGELPSSSVGDAVTSSAKGAPREGKRPRGSSVSGGGMAGGGPTLIVRLRLRLRVGD